MTHPNTRQPSSAWTVQKRPGKPLMKNVCSAITFRFSWALGKTFSSPLESMCESSANRCPAASTSPVLWEARPGDGTLRTVVMTTSRLCVACLNMKLQPGNLGCQLSSQSYFRKFSWRQPETTPVSFTPPQLKQSSRNIDCPPSQRVSKRSPS